MARRIIKKLGGDRIGSGNKMMIEANGYGFSTHDVGKVRRTSMSFGTIVPMGQWLLTSNSKLKLNLDALITSNALLYQLYGSAKFQIDVYSARMALYNPKMLLNLNDQGYEISDIKFPLMELTTNGINGEIRNLTNQQVSTSALLRYLGIAGNGQAEANRLNDVTRKYNAMWLLMYYQIGKEYYANKQEKIGMIIHNESPGTGVVIESMDLYDQSIGAYTPIWEENQGGYQPTIVQGDEVIIGWRSADGTTQLEPSAVQLVTTNNVAYDVMLQLANGQNPTMGTEGNIKYYTWTLAWDGVPINIKGYRINQSIPFAPTEPKLKEFDLKAVDRMQMKLMANVEETNPIEINENTEFPYGASFKSFGEYKCINGSQEGLLVGTYQSDVFNNWLDNATINALTSKSKVKVDENGEFSIDMLNITQKLYNYDQRIGITDGTLDEWRELTYGQASKGKSLKPVYEGGLSKEIVFDQIVSTAGTDQEPLGSIASRGQFGNKHKGGYVEIQTDEEKMVMVLCKITPRIVYNQGNDWTNNLKTLEDLHKPALDKIGYQNLITDQMVAAETIVKADGSLITYTAGKQPAWQWYRTNYDDALGNMADTEDYKVFGRSYELELIGNDINSKYRIKDLTTYIDPVKYNDVFAIASLDAMNFDVQVGMDATLTLVMSEEVIPNL